MLLAAASPARAAAPKLELKTVPAKLQLSTSATATATVLVTNAGDAAASHLRLTVADGGGISSEATLTPTTSTALAPGGSLAYELTVPAWTLATAPTGLTVLAEYRAEGVEQATAAAVEMAEPAPLDPDKVASVELKASLATLKSGHTEPVYLLVHNKSARKLTVKEIEPSGPSFIDFKDLPTGVEVDPGQVKVITIGAEAERQLSPGEQQLVFRLAMLSGKSSFDFVASQTAKVAVSGESEVLTALGVPSLLLLPGFLALATAAIFWRIRWCRKEWDEQAFPFALKEPEFWVLAVAASIAIVAGAARLGTDLLDRYGLEELVCIWVVSMIIGAAGYRAGIEIYNRWREARAPTTEDGAIAVLKKVEKQGLSLKRPRIEDVVDGKSVQLFLLQGPNEKREGTWASPQISCAWTDSAGDELKGQIRAQLDGEHDAGKLAALLAQGEASGQLTAGFAANERGVTGPVLLPKAKIAPSRSTVMVGED